MKLVGLGAHDLDYLMPHISSRKLKVRKTVFCLKKLCQGNSFVTHINLVLACSETGLALVLVESTTLQLLPHAVRESVVCGSREGW